MARDVLTADRTYYVRSDALYADAPGLIDSADGACRTWQQAVDLVAVLDLGGRIVTIRHGAEAGPVTFAEHVNVPTLVGGGYLAVQGSATPGRTVFDSSSVAHSCFTLTNTNTPVIFRDLTLQGGGGQGLGLLQPNESSTAIVSDGVRFGTAAVAHVWVHDRQAKAYMLGASYSIVGSAAYHVYVNMGDCFLESCSVALVGTPAFSGGFVVAASGGALQAPLSSGNLFTGAATGQRYYANANGVINTFGGGANYFPGSAIGAVASGGQYV